MSKPVKPSNIAIDDAFDIVPLLSQRLSKLQTAEGRKQLETTLNKLPYPHYKPLLDIQTCYFASKRTAMNQPVVS